MVLTKIAEKAKGIPDFEKLPSTAQIALLHTEILEARKFRIPHAAICAVLNEAGSKVTVRYFRDVLSVIGKSLKDVNKEDGAPPLTKDISLGTPQIALKTTLKPSEKRQQKADFYTKSNNPLFHQLHKTQE